MITIGLYNRNVLLLDNYVVDLNLCNTKQIIFVAQVLRNCLSEWMSLERVWNNFINAFNNNDDDIEELRLWTIRIVACWDDWTVSKLIPKFTLH